MVTGEGQAKAPKEESKAAKIEESLQRLNMAVGEVESLARRITGEPTVDSKEQGKSSRGVGCLLSDLPIDLDGLDSRLVNVRAAIQEALY